MKRHLAGFTLVELLVVIVVTGILAASLSVFMKPAIDSYFDSRRRAEMTATADTALRQMTQELRAAVPNSVRRYSASCIQFVPSITGGRYRLAADTANAGSLPLDTTTGSAGFDVLTPMRRIPAKNDWIVIDNQNGNDVYSGNNRGQIASVTPAVTATEKAVFEYRVVLAGSTQFPAGYDGGRFMAVANDSQSVFYHCVNNTLYRTTASFAAGSAQCGVDGASVLASDITNCAFDYSVGATEHSAFVWLLLQLARAGEAISLAHGVHIDNVP